MQVRSDDTGALENAGYQHRRMERAGACDTAYQRCERSCTVPAAGNGVLKPAAKAG